MKQLLTTVLLVTISTVVHAQVTCQTYGNTTNCNGSLGSAISPQGVPDFGKLMTSYGNAQAAQEAAQAQAELARAQAEAIHQQTAAIKRQQFLGGLAAASDDDLRTATINWNGVNCGRSAACRDEAAFAGGTINAEVQRRKTEQQSDWYDQFLACLRRFPPGKSSDEAAAINDRCKHDVFAAPTHQDTSSAGTSSTEIPAALPPSPRSHFRQEWDALDDALANGVITRAEYDKKLSVLLQQHRRKQVDRRGLIHPALAWVGA